MAVGPERDPLFEKEISVRSYEVDEYGRVPVTAIMNYLQEAAGDHARLLGVSVRDLMSRGLTWVISRMHLRIPKHLVSRQQLVVRTWPSLLQGRFSCREFELRALNGEIAALATMSFAVLELATRRPVVIAERIPGYRLLRERAIEDDFPTLPRLGDADNEMVIRVGRSDLDVNHHANNVCYVAWAIESVPEEIWRNFCIAELEISYRAEVLHGEKILVRTAATAGGESPTFCHQLVRKEDGTELTRMMTRWERSVMPAWQAP